MKLESIIKNKYKYMVSADSCVINGLVHIVYTTDGIYFEDINENEIMLRASDYYDTDWLGLMNINKIKYKDLFKQFFQKQFENEFNREILAKNKK